MRPFPRTLAGAAVALLLVLGGTLLVPGGGAEASPQPQVAAPTYVVLIHGFDPSTVPAWSVWTEGVDMEAQFIEAGYQVIVVSYYGEFTMTFSSGLIYSDPTFFGTTETPIEQVGSELGKALTQTIGNSGANVDLVGHSMGGLVAMYMMEHDRIPGITLRNVVFLGSPLGGAPITLLSQFDNMSGYQAVEMEAGNAFLVGLKHNVTLAQTNYPGAEWLAYAGDANPAWGLRYFHQADDGLVEVSSVTALGYDHRYLFPVLHIPELDAFDPGHVSYFEYPAVTREMLDNFQGIY